MHVRQQIRDILEDLDWLFYEDKQGFRVNGKPELWDWLKDRFIKGEDYRKSSYVRISRDVLDWPQPMLNELFEGMVLGDGFRDESRILLYSASEGLCDDVQELLFKTGRAGSVRCYRDDCVREWEDGRKSECGKSYVVSVWKNSDVFWRRTGS